MRIASGWVPALLVAAILIGSGCLDPAPRPAASPASEQPTRSMAPDPPMSTSLAPASSESTTPSTQPPTPAFYPFNVTDDCPFKCWEPSVAVDPAGRVFATGAIETPLYRSADGGRSFDAVSIPRALDGSQGNRFDAMVQVDPLGRLWYSALVRPSSAAANQASGMTGAWLAGIQVARSDDGGETWSANQYLSLFESPQEPVYGADRQWLGFAPDGTAYLVYSHVGTSPLPQPASYYSTGLWSARSDDGGATWTAWARAAPYELRLQMGQHGPPVVDAAGNVHIPAFAYSTQPPASRSFNVFTSHDKGITWTPHVIAAWPLGGGTWLPTMVVGADDALHAAWVNAAENRIYVATSTDNGDTWAAPVAWTPEDAHATISPWLIAHSGGTLDLAWFRLDDATVSAQVTRGTTDGPLETHELASGLAGNLGRDANTDFAHGFALGERSVIVWSDPETASLRLSFG